MTCFETRGILWLRVVKFTYLCVKEFGNPGIERFDCLEGPRCMVEMF